MRRATMLADARVGPHLEIDSEVRLNVISGRRLRVLKPLVLGAHARLRSGTVLYAHSVIGAHLQTGHHVVIREENRVGSYVSVWNGTTIDYGCVIGNHVKIHSNCYIAQYSVLEDHVFLAPGVVFANDLFPGSKEAARVLQGPIIRSGAQIGGNVTVLPGVEIGRGAVIGAGSVVTRDVPAFSLAWGNPARVQKSRQTAKWPAGYRIRRPDAAQFYRKRLLGKPAY